MARTGRNTVQVSIGVALLALAVVAATRLLSNAAPESNLESNANASRAPRAAIPRQRLSPAARDSMLRELREARAKRAEPRAVTPAAPPTPMADPAQHLTEGASTQHAGQQAAASEGSELPKVTRKYIQRQVAEIRPLLEECVSQSAHEAADGTLEVSFVIDGEPGIGGLVRDTRVLRSTFPMSKELESCVTETLYSMKIEPPEDGGFIKVNYPFEVKRSRITGPGLDEAEAQPSSPEMLPGFRRDAPRSQAAGAPG